ncbi:DUF257 family protein [Thermococcus sp.]|uniref:DUF257 family protein n=1 Tax=Thermococcus sp. TaxID=35749 RepID=UPI0025CC75A9|nr:DUF257 family protein [Thermococcus sp.]
MNWEKATEIADSLLPGETVLVKYTTSYIPEFLLKFFVDYSKRKEIPLLIDDNFDTLHSIAIRAEMMNLPLKLDDVYVIKTGGKLDVGNVVAKVQFHPDPRVYLKNYEEAIQEALKEIPTPVINLVIGVENLFLIIRTPLDAYRLILAMQKFMGNRNRKAFYIVNETVMENLPIKVLQEFERIATTVIRLTPYHTGATLRVIKSINPNLIGREEKIDVEGWM